MDVAIPPSIPPIWRQSEDIIRQQVLGSSKAHRCLDQSSAYSTALGALSKN